MKTNAFLLRFLECSCFYLHLGVLLIFKHNRSHFTLKTRTGFFKLFLRRGLFSRSSPPFFSFLHMIFFFSSYYISCSLFECDCPRTVPIQLAHFYLCRSSHKQADGRRAACGRPPAHRSPGALRWSIFQLISETLASPQAAARGKPAENIVSPFFLPI